MVTEAKTAVCHWSSTKMVRNSCAIYLYSVRVNMSPVAPVAPRTAAKREVYCRSKVVFGVGGNDLPLKILYGVGYSIAVH